MPLFLTFFGEVRQFRAVLVFFSMVNWRWSRCPTGESCCPGLVRWTSAASKVPNLFRMNSRYGAEESDFLNRS